MSDGKYNPFKLDVLKSKAFSYTSLMKAWGTQPRDINASLHKFHVYNSKYFKFLDITSKVIDDGGEPKIELTASKYVGCIPTLSPKGRYAGNVLVKGRFSEDIAELLSMIGESPLLEYNNNFKLSNGSVENPPLYFECLKYIDKYIEAKKYKWRKFESIDEIEIVPSASTNWNNYAMNSIDPNNRFKYLNKKNILTKDHPEWTQLNYVLNIAIKTIQSPSTPSRSRNVYIEKISRLRNILDRSSVRYATSIPIRMSDPIVIKELKTIANRILQGKSRSDCAWRIDFAEFFERYVQFIIKDISRQKNAKVYCNPKYSVRGERPYWALKYIEPDVIMEKDGAQYVIDAKYKSHMYNIPSSSEKLKEDFRHDFLQVLAYSSFDKKVKKHVMLVYPSNEFIVRRMNVESSVNQNSANAYLVGIPLRREDYKLVKEKMSEIIQFQ